MKPGFKLKTEVLCLKFGFIYYFFYTIKGTIYLILINI